MSPAVRGASAVALGLFLAWQAVTAVIDLGHEAAAVPVGDRRRALVAPESERIERSLVWIELYRAIEKHVPEESIVAVCFSLGPKDQGKFDAFYQVVTLIYPRRVIPVRESLPVAVVEGMADAARKLARPTFIVDLRSGYPLPEKRSRIAEGPDFTLWRVDR